MRSAGDTSSKMMDDVQPAETVVANADINFAAALRAQYAIETPKKQRRQGKKLTREEAAEPLVDTTTALPLRSKKTERLQKRKTQKAVMALNLVGLPSEIIIEVLSHLPAADVFRVGRVSRMLREFVTQYEKTIAKNIMRARYWILHRCFPLPVAFKDVPEEFHAGLLSDKRQELLNIHRKSYHQHIEMVDPLTVCTCMTCVFAWNNLCLLVDLHHWQTNLASREPIPMIPRGTTPQWNQDLLKHNADIVRSAMESDLYYVAILEKHLATITGTISRFAKWKNKYSKAKPRLYHMTDWDLASGTDGFLDRNGPPSYDFPFHRDNYYSVEAYLPNRKFGADMKWHYYALPPAQHERDLEWVRSTFNSSISPEQRRAQALANLKDHNIRWSQYLERLQQV